MKSTTLWTTTVFVCLAFMLACQKPGQEALAADNKKKDAEVAQPADRVAVMYFHRTKRCDTCKKIGLYVEKTAKKDFAKQMKDKTVGLYFIDLQQKKNAKIVKAFKVKGPTLIVVKTMNNKNAGWKPMPQIWKLVGKEKKFSKYVRDGVMEYLKNLEKEKKKDKKKDKKKTSKEEKIVENHRN